MPPSPPPPTNLFSPPPPRSCFPPIFLVGGGGGGGGLAMNSSDDNVYLQMKQIKTNSPSKFNIYFTDLFVVAGDYYTRCTSSVTLTTWPLLKLRKRMTYCIHINE